MSLQSFPGVYTQVIDDSFITPTVSRFRVGLIGPATAGPVNVRTQVISVGDFNNKFGASLPGTYLGNAVQLVSNLSDGATVVRIARQYSILSTSGASATGTSSSTIINTPNAPLFSVDDYVRVSQIGLPSTVNALVLAVSSTALTLDTPLASTYTHANIDRSRVTPDQGDPEFAKNAANEAEAFIKVPVWSGTVVGGGTPVRVSGAKGSFSVIVQEGDTGSGPVFGNSPVLTVGSVCLLQNTGQNSTREIMVESVVPPVPGVKGKINFVSTNQVDTGYQAVSLQDQYGSDTAYTNGTGATITLLSSYGVGYMLLAADPGTWANSDGQSTGLIVQISPGSQPDTKKILVYDNSTLVELWDNMSASPTVLDGVTNTQVTNPNFYPNAINGNSQFIAFALSDPTNNESCWLLSGNPTPPANTQSGWALGQANWINKSAFLKGFDGENVVDSDYIGTIDPVTEAPSGIQVFNDRENTLNLDFIAAPGVTSISVASAMDAVNRVINSATTFDSPAGLTLRQVTDWSNAVGQFTGIGMLDTYTVAIYFNWFTMVDAWTGEQVSVPPTCGALRALAYTFDAFKPWFAAAGVLRGQLPEALALAYPKLSDDAKQASYGNGNVVNSIIVQSGAIMVYGNRTTQRIESKMTALNNVVLVNTILRNMSAIGKKYVFDPIDSILYSQLNTDFSNYLNSVQNDQGIEQYNLVIDSTNNTAADRNARQVNVSLYVIPTDAMERLYITAIVRESGAVLNSVQ